MNTRTKNVSLAILAILAVIAVGAYYLIEYKIPRSKDISASQTTPHETSADYAYMGEHTWNAFKCSIWASALSNKTESQRLYDFGYQQGLLFVDAWKGGQIDEADISRIVPMGVTTELDGPTEEHALGRIYASAKQQALKEIAADTGDTANDRYQALDCSIIGK